MNIHSFIICAYNESPYLEECIESIMSQQMLSYVAIATSTPCDYIFEIAKKYNLEVFVRDGKSDIRDDWNFAVSCAKTNWVTIAHQDDVYESNYSAEIVRAVENCGDAILAITDYRSLIDGAKSVNKNCRIRRLLRMPLKNRALSEKKCVKKMILSLGNSICCPTVAYNIEKTGKEIFTSNMKFNIDWDTFLKYAGYSGRFVYVDKPLVNYRVHAGATTKECMESNLRIEEDTLMFNKFWPRRITKMIMHFYKGAYEEYE